MLVVLPFWTSLLLRVYAWIGLLKANGVINNVLLWLGVIHEPLAMLYTPFAMYVGIVYSYLPFMILPLYSNLEKMDWQLLEAAEDLGCRPWQAFSRSRCRCRATASSPGRCWCSYPRSASS